MLRAMTAADVVERTGRTLSGVYSCRSELGLEDGRKSAATARTARLYEHCIHLLPKLQEMRGSGQPFQKLADWLNNADVLNKRGPGIKFVPCFSGSKVSEGAGDSTMRVARAITRAACRHSSG